MDQEKYNLCRKSFSVFLQDMMKELLMSSDFADVTLVCEDKKQIKAHRNILSACSPVFKEILQIDGSPSSIIYLRGVGSSHMESLLQFIYIGEATIPQDQINEFLSLAKSFDLKDLTEDWEKSGNLGDLEEETEMAHGGEESVTLDEAESDIFSNVGVKNEKEYFQGDEKEMDHDGEESVKIEHSEAETDTFSKVDVKLENDTSKFGNILSCADFTCKEDGEILVGNRIKCVCDRRWMWTKTTCYYCDNLKERIKAETI